MAHEIDGLSNASMAVLLVTKQDLNYVIGSGKSPTNLEAMSLNYWNIVDLDVILQFHAVDPESSMVWNQIQLDMANPPMKYVMKIWCTDIGSHY